MTDKSEKEFVNFNELKQHCDYHHLQLSNQISDDISKKLDENIKNVNSEFKQHTKEVSEKINEVKNQIIELKEAVSCHCSDSQLLEKTVNDMNKIIYEFKGNGRPGVWERVRSLENKFKYVIGLFVILVILSFGGSVNRITKKDVQNTVDSTISGYSELYNNSRNRSNEDNLVDIKRTPTDDNMKKE